MMVMAVPSAEVSSQALARVTFQGEARPIPVEAPIHAAAKRAYLARFPSSAQTFELGDFALFAIRPTTARYVGGFAQARPALQVLLLQQTWLEPPQAAHTPGVFVVRPEQIRFAPHAVAAEAEQQGCPEPPHAVHMLLSQAPPG